MLRVLFLTVSSVAGTSASAFSTFMNFVPQSQFRVTVLLDCGNITARDIFTLNQVLLNAGGTFERYNINDRKEITRFLDFKPYHTNVWLNSNCNQTRSVLEGMSERSLLNGSRRIFLSGNDSMNILPDQNINFDSEIYLLGKADVHRVFSVARRQGTPLHVLREKKKLNLDGHVLSVAFIIPKTPKGLLLMPYMQGVGGGHLDNVNRLGNDYAVALSEMYNFKVHWVRVTSWGYLGKDNKSFSGAVGALQRKEVDFATSLLFYTVPRHPVIDIAPATICLRLNFLFRHPSHGRGVVTLRSPFLRPVSDDTWSVFFVVILLVIFTLLLTQRNNLGSIVLIMIGILSQQGVVEELRKLSSKIVLFFALFMSFMFFQFYSASIVGTLLTQTPHTITNLQRLMGSDLKVAIEDLPLTVPLFQFFEPTKIFWQKKIKGNPKLISSLEVSDYVRKGYAVFGYLDPVYDVIKQTFTPDEIDELQEVSLLERSVDLYTHFPLQKYSPYKEMIRVGCLQLWEMGMVGYWKSRWIMAPPAGNFKQFKTIEVDFERVKGVMCVVGCGYLISLVVFAVEVFYFRFIVRFRQRRQQNMKIIKRIRRRLRRNK